MMEKSEKPTKLPIVSNIFYNFLIINITLYGVNVLDLILFNNIRLLLVIFTGAVSSMIEKFGEIDSL